MKTALENFITRHGLEEVIHAQAIQNAIDEELQMIEKAYQAGADDAIKSVVDDSIPNAERYYKKTFQWC